MTDKPIPIPEIVIKPKISGFGLVLKKDGTVSVPEQQKEKEHGSNPANIGA